MTLCAQYTDNMKKRTLAQNGTNPKDDLVELFNKNSIGAAMINNHLVDVIDEVTFIRLVEELKPKRPRGKKVYSTDKGAKRWIDLHIRK